MRYLWTIAIAASCTVGCTAHSNLGTHTEATQSGNVILLDEYIGENRLQVFGYGDPAQILRLRTIYGNGLLVVLTNCQHQAVFNRGWGEDGAGGIIDYTEAASGAFKFTDCTTDYRSKLDHVGFIETTVRIRKDGTTDIKRRIVLNAERASHESVEKYVQQGLTLLAAHEEDVEAQFIEVLEHLRNMGIENPDMVLGAMKSLSSKTDGALGEALSDYMDEVELAKDIREGR